MTQPEPPLVLIVEDDAIIARLLHDVFRLRGMRPLVARSATAAAAALLNHRPALMTLDLSMPGVSGETLLHVVRAHPETSRLPVIVITSHFPVEPAVAGQVDAVLEKPFELSDLLGAVERALGGARPSARELGG